MAEVFHQTLRLMGSCVESLYSLPFPVLLVGFVCLLIADIVGIYLLLRVVAPTPRLPLPSEKTYQTTVPDSDVPVTRQLPCWYDTWFAEHHVAAATAPAEGGNCGDVATPDDAHGIAPAEVGLTVIVPAYNEALRILPALDEMVAYCDSHFGRVPGGVERVAAAAKIATKSRGKGDNSDQSDTDPLAHTGYEIVVVDDASTDGTGRVVLAYARARGLHDVVRVVTLAHNRGKGGGVTHGMRHARGALVVFADADGASRFGDLDRLREGCQVVVDASGRGVAIGSRAHLVGSAAVVQRSALRNLLMRGFHFVLMILTPPATSRLRDTQCGFKLLSRAALPHIVPYMHTEGWIFDIEMLMLAESAPPAPVRASDGTVIGTSPGIKVAEVSVVWHEVDGSKMNLVQDSIRMALGLAVLRASWMLGVYRRRLA